MSTEQKPKREIPQIYSQVIKETTLLRKRNAPGVSLDKVKPYFSYYLNHEMTISEIAEKTEMSINAVKCTIARARKAGILPPVTEESIKIAKSRAHLGRGRLQNMILPDLLQGMSIKEVMEKHNLSYSQVKGVIRNARDKGVLPRPTREEISQKLRTSHLGKPSPRKDKRISADALIAKLSSTKGEDLSESEKAYFRALVKAREIVDTVRVPRLEELYQQYKRKLNKGKQGKRLNVLEMIYASLVSSGLADSEHNFSYLSMMDVLNLYNSKYNQHIDLNNLVDDVHFISTALNNILPESNLRINSDVDQFFLCGKAEIPEKYLDLLAKFFLPVLLRGGTMDDVAKISGHDYEVIEEVISHLTRRGLFSLNVNCSENASYVVQKDNATEDNQENYLRMARSLISQELLSNSLSSWEELHKLYRSYQRSLPSFVERIILEVFLIARKQAMNMDKSLLESYILTGETVDKEWFETSSLNEEQFFITRHLALITENLPKLSPKKEKNVVFSAFLREDDVYISGRRIA